jgi:hypothetical protein
MKLVVLLIALTGCVMPPQQQGQPAPAAGAADGTAQPAPAGIGCVQIFECFKTCADEACTNACAASGDPASQAAMAALLQCTAQPTGDGTCSAEIETCRTTGATTVAQAAAAPVAQPAAAPTDPRQPHTTENILAWMVGSWIGNNHQFVFNADGTVRRSMGGGHYTDKGNLECVSSFNDTGPVTQQGDLLIMVFSPSSSNNCGHDNDGGKPITVRYRISWVENHYDNDPNLQLVLTDIDCTSGAMWCSDALTRR